MTPPEAEPPFRRLADRIRRAWITTKAAVAHGARRIGALTNAAVDRRRVLTVPVRWPPLRWLDRPLAYVLRLDPRLLSSRISIKPVPISGSLWLRFKSWLWEQHSVQTGVLLAILFGVDLCLIAWTVSKVIDVPMLGRENDIGGFPTLLIAAAAYSGTLFGFLQAVTIFAVQIRSQRDTSILALTPLIARRHLAFLLLGTVAGVTVANLLGSFAVPLLPISRSALGALVWVDLIAVPGETIVAVGYLASIISEVADADIDVALPILRATMRAQIVEDGRTLALLNEYVRTLEAAGIRYDPFADTRLAKLNSKTERIPFARPGVVVDVDCHRLRLLNQLLAELDPVPQVAVTATIDQRVSREDVLVLRWESAETSAEAAPAEPLDHARRRRVETLLKGLFFVKPVVDQ